MKGFVSLQDISMSNRYRQYLLGWAYIPHQDLPKYEKAYKKVNNIRK